MSFFKIIVCPPFHHEKSPHNSPRYYLTEPIIHRFNLSHLSLITFPYHIYDKENTIFTLISKNNLKITIWHGHGQKMSKLQKMVSIGQSYPKITIDFRSCYLTDMFVH